MINTTDLKNSTAFMYYDQPYKVINYEHIKMSRGGATVKVKCVDLITGAIKEISFSSNEKVQEADVENINLQYLYKDNDNLYFMNDTDFTQSELPLVNCKEDAKYLIEGNSYQVMVFKGQPISLIIPASLFFKVKVAPDAVKGNTSSSATKKVILENDLEVEVPQFIKENDVIKINTTYCSYSGRGTSK